MKSHICQQCGATFQAKPAAQRRFCSKRCYGDWKLLPLMEPRTCDHCGAVFVPKRHAFTTAAYQGAYCSVACSNKARAMPMMERYLGYVAIAERTDKGCLLWPAGRDGSGYGFIAADGGGRQVTVHRLSYEIRYGPIPDGLDVLHRCDTPPCFEAEHLFLGTDLDNKRDMIEKKRHVHGETHPRAALNDVSVLDIRARVAAGEKQIDLAHEYRVTRTAISLIVSRRTWKHLE